MTKKLTVSDVSFLLSQWDYEKNVELDTNKLSASSHKPANWCCKKCGYEWKCSIKSRYGAKGKCPVCDSGKVILPGINDAFTRIPELKETYAFEKNKGFDIEHQGINSVEMVWWKCDGCGREWKASIHGRRVKCHHGGYSVTKCSHLAFATKKENRPISEVSELMRFWNTDKNIGIDVHILSANSKKMASWKCDNCGYEWISSIKGRYESFGLCPACEQYRVVIEGISDIFTLVEGLKNYYDFEKNSNVDITTLTVSSTLLLSWKCKECCHEWESIISSRIKRIDGKYVSRECHQCYLHDKNRITPVASIHSLVEFWDFEKNADKDINLTSAHSYETTHWKCKKCGYEWEATIKGRAGGSGQCPYCEEHQPVLYPGKNDVLTLCYSTTKYFDTSKNEGIDLGQVYVGSKMELDFKCPMCGREWEAPLNSRIRKQKDGTYRFKDCFCHHTGRRKLTYAEQYPRLNSIFDKNKNPKPLAEILSGEIREKYHWICDVCDEPYYTHFHSVIAAIKNTGTIGCPYCSHTLLRKGESFAYVHPELVAEYDEANTIDIHQVFPSSKKEVSWKCLNDPSHKWQATFAARHAGFSRCPVCYPTIVRPGVNSLQVVYEDIADMWSDRNERNADEILFNSSLWVYLNCPECHMEFGAFLKDFISGKTECPYCTEKRVLPGWNSFQARHPDLLEEWDYVNNYVIADPDTIGDKNNTKVWWICTNDHSHHYPMSVKDKLTYQKRHRESCPYCKGRRRKKRHFV